MFEVVEYESEINPAFQLTKQLRLMLFQLKQ